MTQQMNCNKCIITKTGQEKEKLNLTPAENIYVCLPGAMSLAAAKFDVFLHSGLYGSIS